MKNYKITIADAATYIIRTNAEETALECALAYFDERKPEITIQITDEEADVTIDQFLNRYTQSANKKNHLNDIVK